VTPGVGRWAGGIDLDVHVQPRAAKDAIGGVHGTALRIRVRAAARDGEANAAVCRVVARAFAVRARDVELQAGRRGRRKRLRIAGDPAALLERAALLAQGEIPV
jgi:uncharacterized protein (TIGR00251 family)